jgi:signal transduction histidine kinase
MNRWLNRLREVRKLQPNAGRLFLLPARTLADPHEAKDAECTLIAAQALLAFGCLLVVCIAPHTPSTPALIARLSLLLYASFSVLMAMLVQRRLDLNRPQQLVLHVIGVFWCAIAFLFMRAWGSQVFAVFLLFILFAAAYRWGLAQTLLTAASCGALLLLARTLAAGSRHSPAITGGGLAQWTIPFLFLGCAFGYLLEKEKRLRSDASTVSSLIASVQAGVGIRKTLQTTLRAMLDLFNSRRIAVALQHTGSGRSFLWDAERQGSGKPIPVHLRELAPLDQGTYFFNFPAECWCATMLRGTGAANRFRIRAMSNQGERLRRVSCFLPFSFLSRRGFRSLLAVSFNCGSEWSGRVFVFDSRRRRRPEANLQLLRKLIRDATPVIYKLYFLGGYRFHVRRTERARVARDLHDGAIQSLIALEMEIGVLSHRATAGGTGEKLKLIQSQLASVVQDFRDLMERVKPIELDPHQLTSHLADIVDKFRIRTGISASFVCESDQITAPPHVCHELVRVVQEALVNVRKHSGARKVTVRCVPVGGQLKVTIDDNGCGFDFSGRLSFAELEATGKGPVVIRERLRSIGGECALESVPGRGARLEILLPT